MLDFIEMHNVARHHWFPLRESIISSSLNDENVSGLKHRTQISAGVNRTEL